MLIKFAPTYSIEVHQAMEELGYAPKLHHWKKNGNIPNYCVVMEKVIGECVNVYLAKNPDKKSEVLQECSKILEIMRSADFCHGDFRSPNILVRDTGKVCLIDYEWSGKVGEATYPFFMNHVSITWPEGAIDGGLVQKEHDTYWLKHLT